MKAFFLVIILGAFNFAKAQTDTTYYYFNDGRLSVKIAPQADRQKIWVSHIMGEQIYEFENVRMSYSVSNTLSFRQDGSLEKVVTNTNPGASRHWYITETVFHTDNEPRYQKSHQMPFDTLMDAVGTTYLWIAKEKRWQKQEIAICQPVNEGF